MGNNFSFFRLGKLFANEFLVNQRRYLYLWGGVVAAAVIYLAGVVSMGRNPLVVEVAAFVCAMVLGVMQLNVIVMHFGDVRKKARLQSLLMLPATSSEKYVAKFIWSVIVYPVMGLSFFLLFSKAAIDCSHLMGGVYPTNFSSWIDWNEYSKSIFLMFVSIWFFAVSALLLGNMVFRKAVAAKVAIVLVVAGFLISPVMSFFYFLGSGHLPASVNPFQISDHGVDVALFVTPEATTWGLFALGLTMLVISKIRFNEKTV